MRELVLRSSNSENIVNQYDLNGVVIHGVCWTGQNLQSVKEVVGFHTDIVHNGKVFVFGRPLEIGDFVYTDLDEDQMRFYEKRSDVVAPIDPSRVFIIEYGKYQILRET